MRITLQIMFACAAITGGAFAADTPVSFDSDLDRARYETLLGELRCLVCQNQSLADSHADLAQDLRDTVYTMVVAGQDNDAIVAFMVARYGDFVRYKPAVKSSTWLLWFGPALLLLIAGVVVYGTTRGRTLAPQPMSSEERAKVQALMENDAE